MINHTQLVVSTDKTTIDWLVSQGYANPHNLPNDYRFSVFVVDLMRKEIYGTNTTCMAASCSCGNRPIVLCFEKLKEKLMLIKNNFVSF
ncbi:MAG: hypothetical protein K2J16_03765 [Clostridia bacterium]|nr:hypothetical protein [Clostridia bacterium]